MTYSAYLEQVPKQIAQLRALSADEFADREIRDTVLRVAHQIAGTSLTFGQRQAGLAASDVCRLLRNSSCSHDELVNAVNRLLYELEQIVANPESPNQMFAPMWIDEEISASKPLLGRTFVVVEDSSALAGFVEPTLLAAGARSVSLLSGLVPAQEALANVCQVPDAILIDHFLGRQRGTDLVAWIVRQPSLASSMRISYSSARRDDIEHSARGAYHAYIQKPIAMPDLVKELVAIFNEWLS